ncbi:MAG: dihydroorotase [Chromatiales bacterium]|jgi:dihydroorotase|nr:dihydroorotase [Chromatiales bacterium]
MRIHIRQGRLVDPGNEIDDIRDVYVADGVIVGVGTAPEGFHAESTIDARGRVVCPGLIDLRAHLREPGEEHKATIASETAAAARGGITSVCCTPNTRPVIDTPAVAGLIRRRARSAGMARVIPIGAFTQALDGEHLSEMAALKQAGCLGVSNGFRPMRDLTVMSRAMEYAATFDITVFVNPQDHALANNGCAHLGAVATRLGLAGVPAAAETVAVAALLALVDQIGVRVHFSLLSTTRAAQMIARARHEGLPVSADVSAHHLHLTENDVLDFDSLCHVRPPLRTLRDREGLRQWLARGAISAICSDHQPHEADAKLRPFTQTEPGISGLETLLPLSLRLVDEGVLTMTEAIARLSWHPARILGVQAGKLSVGMPADVCVFDPESHWVPGRHTLRSRGHNTPFLGWEMKGEVTHTLLEGRIVYERDEAPA